MNSMEQKIKKYEQKINTCTTMTDLLVAMSSWQSFADSNRLTKEQRSTVDQAYIKAEEKLIAQVTPSLW